MLFLRENLAGNDCIYYIWNAGMMQISDDMTFGWSGAVASQCP